MVLFLANAKKKKKNAIKQGRMLFSHFLFRTSLSKISLKIKRLLLGIKADEVDHQLCYLLC